MERPDADPMVRRPERFEGFYQREFPKMVGLAAAVSGSRIAAEDIAQDAMLDAQRRWDTIGNYDKPGAWVRRVTIQRASKRLRRARTEAAAALKLGPAGGIPPGDDAVEEVFAAVKRLPARQRAAVALHYLDGYSIAELAEILDCAQGTAKAHLFKARQSLARMLGEEMPA
jgi:RNA polymerase sigma-70 factor (ECF subfamily)